jgi:small subunit ribosomal protein S4e
MVKKLKRFLAPKFWKVPRKAKKFVVSPRPGPHKKFECIPLQIIVRDILKLAETGKEAKAIIKKGEVLVDGRPRKDHAYPVGLFDSIAIPKIKKFYRVVPKEKGLELIEIPEEESNLKICKIENKKVLKKGKIQLNLHDGRNILAENIYKTGDSVLIELPSQKILNHVKLEEGNLAIVTKGKNSGKIVQIKEIVKGVKQNKIFCEVENKKIEIMKDFVFVVGKENPLIKVS